jgi:hypothetical protein
VTRRRRSLSPFQTGAALWRLSFGTALMLAEAQAVIALRLAGMAGLTPPQPGETRRMAAEKPTAFAKAARAALSATPAGPVAAAEAAMRPIRRRTRSNVRRLARPR